MAKEMKKSNDMLADVLEEHIHDAEWRQHNTRDNASQGKPKTWAELEAYAELIASIRVREKLLNIKREAA